MLSVEASLEKRSPGFSRNNKGRVGSINDRNLNIRTLKRSMETNACTGHCVMKSANTSFILTHVFQECIIVEWLETEELHTSQTKEPLDEAQDVTA